MFLAPILFKIYEVINDKKINEEEVTRESDTIDTSGHKVILAGFGRLGTDIGRFLISAGIKPVIIDNDVANVEVLRKFGFKVYYGDITRQDLLNAAGAEDAELLIITMSDIELVTRIVEIAKKHYPHLKIITNAPDRYEQYKLMDLGVEKIRRENFGSALSLGEDALNVLGFDPYQSYRMMRIFDKMDDDMIIELHQKHHESEESYISTYQKHMEDLEEVMAIDMDLNVDEIDKTWTENNPN